MKRTYIQPSATVVELFLEKGMLIGSAEKESVTTDSDGSTTDVWSNKKSDSGIWGNKDGDSPWGNEE